MDTREIRRKASFYRRIANHPTEGGSPADRILVKLAEQLEREADAVENGVPQPPRPSR